MASEDRELAIERLRVRKEMRSAGDEEDSTVIDQKLSERIPKSESTPPRARWVLKFLSVVQNPWQMVVALALVALVAFLAYLAGPAIFARLL